MKIDLAQKEDCPEVAKIHLQEINQGFLSSLGLKFLTLFYEAMVSSRNGFLAVAKEDNKVIGFISGCVDVGEFYREFFKKYKFKAPFILLKRIFNLDFFKKVMEVKKYAKKESADLPKAELLSIAVKKEFQGRGAAKLLLDKFVEEMKRRNINSFRAIVGENLVAANKFYQKNGFQFHSKNFVHKDAPSNIYLYKIK